MHMFVFYVTGTVCTEHEVTCTKPTDKTDFVLSCLSLNTLLMSSWKIASVI